MGIHVEYSTLAKCRPEHAWEKFKVVEQWPWWNSVINKANWVEGQPWQQGSVLYFETARPKVFKVKPTITESNPPSRVVWVGTWIGFRGEHGFSFDPQPDGSTRLKTWEDFSGPATLFLGKGHSRTLEEMYKSWIEALKYEAEKIAREQYARS